MTNQMKKKRSCIDKSKQLMEDIGQLRYPAEFRIDVPEEINDDSVSPEVETPAEAVTPPTELEGAPAAPQWVNRLFVEFATCLWYLKTKYFKHEWDDHDGDDDDPRIRRALKRLRKSVDTLKEVGIEVHDPSNKRYPPGSEGMMRPIQFLPTAGLTFEMVNETVTPIIYLNDRLLQRGEVFVAVPKDEAPAISISDEKSASNDPVTAYVPTSAQTEVQPDGQTQASDTTMEVREVDETADSRNEKEPVATKTDDTAG